jgi:hypothetical protein
MGEINYHLDNSNDRIYGINYGGAELQDDGSYLQDGNIHWYNALGFLHREDGPAFIGSDNTVCWCVDGHCHYTLNSWCITLNKTDAEQMMLRLQYI